MDNPTACLPLSFLSTVIFSSRCCCDQDSFGMSICKFQLILASAILFCTKGFVADWIGVNVSGEWTSARHVIYLHRYWSLCWWSLWNTRCQDHEEEINTNKGQYRGQKTYNTIPSVISMLVILWSIFFIALFWCCSLAYICFIFFVLWIYPTICSHFLLVVNIAEKLKPSTPTNCPHKCFVHLFGRCVPPSLR